jgi:hypothetical protein
MFVLTLMATVVFAASTCLAYDFEVRGNQTWQKTGVSVEAGACIEFAATGEICAHWCWIDYDYKDPRGCSPRIADPCGDRGIADSNYLVPGVWKYSLVGKIGNGTPFYVGDMNTIIASNSGDLYLAYNDQHYSDNVGSFYVTFSAPCGSIADIDIDPDVLNKRSQGRWITCYIELPDPYHPGDIDVSTVVLCGVIAAEAHPTDVGDHDADGIPDRMVKFARAEVIDALSCGDEVEVQVNGMVAGSAFSGADTIRVKCTEPADPGARGEDTSRFGLAVVTRETGSAAGAMVLRYGLDAPSHVRLTIHDVRGRLVRELVNETKAADTYTLEWNGRDNAGQLTGAGIYFAQVDAGGRVLTSKMIRVQ